MAATTVDFKKMVKLGRYSLYARESAFVTSAVTQEVTIPFSTVLACVATYTDDVAVTASDGPLVWTLSSKTLTITRPSGGASAASFNVIVIGF